MIKINEHFDFSPLLESNIEIVVLQGDRRSKSSYGTQPQRFSEFILYAIPKEIDTNHHAHHHQQHLHNQNDHQQEWLSNPYPTSSSWHDVGSFQVRYRLIRDIRFLAN